ncbi:MAG: TolC family protein [Acidobacteriota bacterium]
MSSQDASPRRGGVRRFSVVIARRTVLAALLAACVVAPLGAQQGGAQQGESQRGDAQSIPPGEAGRLTEEQAVGLEQSPAAGAPASVHGGWDLPAVVARALAANSALLAERERRGEVQAQVREVLADALPQLTLRSSWNASRNPSFLNSPDFDDFVQQFPSGSFEPGVAKIYYLGVELNQPLFTWGKTSATRRGALAEAGSTEEQIETLRLDTALAAAEGYWQLRAAQAELDILELQGRVRRQALEVVEARYEFGDATRLELLRAQAAEAELAPDVAQAQGDLEVAASSLRRVLALAPDQPVPLAPEARGPLSTAPSVIRLAEAARDLRPELRDLGYRASSLVEQLAVLEADARPRLDLNGSYGRSARLAEDLTDTLFQDWSVTLEVTWDLFDGGRRKGQAQRLESQRRQLNLRRQDVIRQVILEIESRSASFAAARARWLAQQTVAAAADEASRVAEESYREGVVLQSEWLDAQEEATEAELEASRAYYEARIEQARLRRAAGWLPWPHWRATTPTPAPAAPELPGFPQSPLVDSLLAPWLQLGAAPAEPVVESEAESAVESAAEPGEGGEVDASIGDPGLVDTETRGSNPEIAPAVGPEAGLEVGSGSSTSSDSDTHDLVSSFFDPSSAGLLSAGSLFAEGPSAEEASAQWLEESS